MPDSRRKSKPGSQAGTAEPDDPLRRACAELNLPLEHVLAWKLYPERIVILLKDGRKLSRPVQS